MSASRGLMWRLSAILLVGGVAAAWIFWFRHTTEQRVEDSRSEFDFMTREMNRWSEEDCLALLGDELAAATERLQAANALARRGARSVPAVRQLLSHPTPSVRRYAAMCLGQMGLAARPAVPELLELTSDRDVGVQIPAVDGLARIDPQNPKVLEVAFKLLDHKHPTLRSAAGDALLAVIRAAPERGAELQPRLEKCLTSPHTPIRLAAVIALGTCQPPRIESLVALLQDKDDAIRWKSIHQLGQLGSQAGPAVLPLLQLAASGNPSDQASARRSLSVLGPSVRPALLSCLSNTNSLEVRTEASLLLVMTGTDSPDAILHVLEQAARELSNDAFCWARLQLAFRRLGPRAEPVLVSLERSPLSHVQDLARKSRLPADSRSTLVSRWIGEMNDESPEVRARAAYSLGLMRSDAVTVSDRLAAYENDHDQTVRMAVRWAVAQIDQAAGPRAMRIRMPVAARQAALAR